MTFCWILLNCLYSSLFTDWENFRFILGNCCVWSYWLFARGWKGKRATGEIEGDMTLTYRTFAQEILNHKSGKIWIFVIPVTTHLIITSSEYRSPSALKNKNIYHYQTKTWGELILSSCWRFRTFRHFSHWIDYILLLIYPFILKYLCS